MKFLADENVPRVTVEALKQSGVDITWVGDLHPGADDRLVVELAAAESRILINFDKDFAEMVFRSATRSLVGVILLRISPRSPQFVTDTVSMLLESDRDWVGHFSVVTGTRIRMVPLP